LTSSGLAERNAPADLAGAQRPVFWSVPAPDGGTSAAQGEDAVELAAYAGLFLDDWQQWILREALREKPGNLWAAFEVAMIVSRQNGKGSVLEARELAGLFILGEELLIHTAHEFQDLLGAFPAGAGADRGRPGAAVTGRPGHHLAR
jgi:hypothetical protein